MLNILGMLNEHVASTNACVLADCGHFEHIM